MTSIDAATATAFRVHAHGLDRRRDSAGAGAGAGDGYPGGAYRCALQNSPPGSAVTALHARSGDAGPDTLADGIADRTMIHTWTMRGSPYLFPAADLDVFTTGVRPPTEQARLALVYGVERSLDDLGLGLDDVTGRIRARIDGVLRGRRLPVGPLGAELADAVAGDLPAAARRVWAREGQHAAGQPIGEAVVHFCLRILTLDRVVCFAPRQGNKLPFVLVDEWLGAVGDPDGGAVRAELARRYLRCFGPSTPADLASWIGVRAADADAWWPDRGELAEIDLDGRRTWVLAEDADALADPPQAEGVRLLPPSDPLLALRDRATLVADPATRRDVWRALHAPGLVLDAGRPAGTWRARKRGTTLAVSVEPFTVLARATRSELEEEADGVARVRGCTTATLEIA